MIRKNDCVKSTVSYFFSGKIESVLVNSRNLLGTKGITGKSDVISKQTWRIAKGIFNILRNVRRN